VADARAYSVQHRDAERILLGRMRLVKGQTLI